MTKAVKGVPLTEEVIIALSRLIDDALLERKREPTHSDLEFHIDRAGLSKYDPSKGGKPWENQKGLEKFSFMNNAFDLYQPCDRFYQWLRRSLPLFAEQFINPNKTSCILKEHANDLSA